MAFQYKNVYWLWVSAAVMLADQVSKQLIVRNLGWFDVLPVFPHFNLVHMHNTGAAFSMLSGAPPQFFIVLGVAVSIGILWWLRRNPHGQTLFAAALALILGGALGNVIDRIAFGAVIDFLDFHVYGYHWPAFNVADMGITCGAALLIWDAMTTKSKPAAA